MAEDGLSGQPSCPHDCAKPPRFPYVAALLCAACVGAAGWTWMTYSYCWDATPAMLSRATAQGQQGSWEDRYVLVRGALADLKRSHSAGDAYVVIVDRWPPPSGGEGGRPAPVACVHLLHWKPRGDVTLGQEAEAQGRIVVPPTLPPYNVWDNYLNASCGRFHPASVAGLVVGAMGVFVFSVALGHWLNQRRPFRVETAEGEA